MILSWFRYELYFNVHIFLLTVTYVTRTPLGYGPHLGDVCCLGAGQVVNSFKIHKISSVVAAHFTNSGQWARPAAQARLVRSPRHGKRGDLILGSGETYLWHISNTFCSLQTHETNCACRQFKVISFAQASPLQTPCLSMLICKWQHTGVCYQLLLSQSVCASVSTLGACRPINHLPGSKPIPYRARDTLCILTVTMCSWRIVTVHSWRIVTNHRHSNISNWSICLQVCLCPS